MARGLHRWLVAVISLFGFVSVVLSDEESTQFDVKPGGQVNDYVKEWKGFQCKFTYVCQGGTKEEWMITLKRKKKSFSCTVYRPSGSSYLFFQEFNLQIQGAQIQEANAFGNSNALSADEYKIDKSQNSVSQVAGKFKSELTKLEVKGSLQKKKKEL
ncbi:myeloid-derived growth factor [Octopus bimaculoides]|uniref:Myeloid-derived growth factor n=1 Tax=Octopus bimaculoides TaxID=37653 RepID=A0A0L8GYN3_OCTBM|nr:myeloid-derived growth factor [Octopus bimaculoides]|eukprot:XP_014776918.1 PREDICTED: myeloid-derived growth factor-like [Octopus bimaculoides]